MMGTKGYMMIAQNTPTVDYIRQAYALALSIKNTQTAVKKVAICVDDTKLISESSLKYASGVFDHVIQIPWDDDAENQEWKIHNKWKYLYMTPYDETVALDSDMIFTRDISQWWQLLGNHDMCFTSNVRTFRNEVANGDHYRHTFTSNGLPNVYTAFFYFKNNKLSAEVFRLVNFIFHNFKDFTHKFLDNTRPQRLSGDVAYAMALDILGYTEQCTTSCPVPTFTHMKSFMQNVPKHLITDEWGDHFRSTLLSSGDVMVENYIQQYPFHYHKKDWLADSVIETLERLYEHKYSQRNA